MDAFFLLEEGDSAEEDDAHEDGDGAADAHEDGAAECEDADGAEDGDGGEDEYGGEAEDEEEGGGGDFESALFGDEGAVIVVVGDGAADESGEVANVAGHEGDDAGASERNEAGGHGGKDAEKEGPGGCGGGEGCADGGGGEHFWRIPRLVCSQAGCYAGVLCCFEGFYGVE